MLLVQKYLLRPDETFPSCDAELSTKGSLFCKSHLETIHSGLISLPSEWLGRVCQNCVAGGLCMLRTFKLMVDVLKLFRSRLKKETSTSKQKPWLHLPTTLFPFCLSSQL